jgi:hypothetical protein
MTTNNNDTDTKMVDSPPDTALAAEVVRAARNTPCISPRQRRLSCGCTFRESCGECYVCTVLRPALNALAGSEAA